MPEDGVLKYINRIDDGEINVKKIIKAQHYFKVSFKAMLVRLNVLGLINENQYENFASTHLSTTLPKFGYSKKLIKPTNDTYIPQNYIEILTENFEEGNVTFNAYKEYLNDVGKSPEEFTEEKEVEENYVDETSFDY
jgi:Zn-dependent peptidase ImmA (M78 family)